MSGTGDVVTVACEAPRQLADHPLQGRWPTVRRLWSAYGRCAIGTRLHVVGRFLLCPYRDLLRWFPRHGEVVDIGCGHGLLLWLLDQDHGPERRWLGVDHAADKIDSARTLTVTGGSFRIGSAEELPSGHYDGVSVVDVLYTVPMDAWPSLLRACHRILRDGGRLIVKDVVDRPRWKAWLAYVEEVLAIHVVRLTKGQTPHFEPRETYRAQIEAAGFSVVHVQRLDAWRVHPHGLWVARKA